MFSKLLVAKLHQLNNYSNFLFKLTNFTEHNLIAAYEHLGKQNCSHLLEHYFPARFSLLQYLFKK